MESDERNLKREGKLFIVRFGTYFGIIFYVYLNCHLFNKSMKSKVAVKVHIQVWRILKNLGSFSRIIWMEGTLETCGPKFQTKSNIISNNSTLYS
eukprot:UN02166